MRKYGCCVEDLNGEEPCVMDPNQDDYCVHDCIYAELLVSAGQFKEDCQYWLPCVPVRPEEDDVDFRDLLMNLLAVIHCDGGHYVAEHGVLKAVDDAVAVICELRSTGDGI